jgi:hypothetical protein
MKCQALRLGYEEKTGVSAQLDYAARPRRPSIFSPNTANLTHEQQEATFAFCATLICQFLRGDKTKVCVLIFSYFADLRFDEKPSRSPSLTSDHK